jgi:hypothetical protein
MVLYLLPPLPQLHLRQAPLLIDFILMLLLLPHIPP